MSEWPPSKTRRGVNLVLALASGAAVVGFFTGTHQAPQPAGYRGVARASESARHTAPRQREMEHVRYEGRGEEQQAALRVMAMAPRSPLDAFPLDPGAYNAEVARRREGRSYDGAPPTIPHAVEQVGAPACLHCHERGLAVEGKVAAPISHASFGHCLQCHATRETALRPVEPLAASVSEESSFVGQASPGHGPRAWSVAPPQMPHRTFMRERCASCHGVWSRGISSTHLVRQNCLQCHAPASGLDQAPSLQFGLLGGAP